MISIGITGQAGFVGTHLYDFLGKYPENFMRIPFKDEYFEDGRILRDFVKQCNIIVHFAAIMRSEVEGEVYNTNMHLVNQLIDAMNAERVTPSILFSSSVQENNGSEYGRCKYEGKLLLENWAKIHQTGFGSLIFPNLFGPKAKPFSHSFVATFCYKLTHGEEPQVYVDNVVSLKFINNLLGEMLLIIHQIINEKNIFTKRIEPDFQMKVTEVLIILSSFKPLIKSKMRPTFASQIHEDLFETLISYVNYSD